MKKARYLLTGLLALSLVTACQTTPTSSSPTSSDSQETSSPGSSSSSSSTPITAHSITIGETDGATLTLDKKTASSGERVTVTVSNIPEGQQLEEITTDVEGVSLVALSETEYYFIMPNCDVTISCTLSEAIQATYGLTIQNNTDAEIVSLMDNTGAEYTSVEGTYELEPGTSYLLRLSSSSSVSVTLNGERIIPTEGYYTFRMPSKDSTMVIDYVTTYSVTFEYDTDAISGIYLLDADTGAQLSSNAIEPGTKVGVSPTLNDGYEINQMFVNDDEVVNTVDGYIFTMPSEDVTLSITTIAPTFESHKLIITEGEGVTLDVGNVTNGVFTPLEGFYAQTSTFPEGTLLYLHVSIMPLFTDIYELDSVTVDGEVVTVDETGYYPVTVGNHDVEIEALSSLIQYPLSYQDDTSDSVYTACTFADAEGNPIQTAGYGETVVATFTNSSNLALYQVFHNGTLGTGTIVGNTYTFTMGRNDLRDDFVLTASFADLSVEYNLGYVTNPTGHETTIKVTFYDEELTEITKATAGEKVYAKVTGLNRYILNDVILQEESLDTETVKGEEYYVFNALAEDTQLTVDVTPLEADQYYLYKGDVTGLYGVYDSTLNPIRMYSGNYVLTAGETYYLDIYYSGQPISKVTVNGVEATLTNQGGMELYEFVMPSEDATLAVELEVTGYKLSYTIVGTDPSNVDVVFMDMMMSEITSAKEGAMVYVSPWSDTATIVSVTLDGEPIEGIGSMYSFTMPGHDVNIVITCE